MLNLLPIGFRLLLIGGDVDTAMETVVAVIPLLEDNQKQQNAEYTTELRLMIHQSQAGCVIGRGGDKIKELRQVGQSGLRSYSATSTRPGISS
jgi:heterogeneous nuclear ribonucleoprotein K